MLGCFDHRTARSYCLHHTAWLELLKICYINQPTLFAILGTNCQPVVALLLVSFGETVIVKTLGWSGEFAERRPNDAVFWASIQWAKSHGYHYFHFERIDRVGAELMLSGNPLPEELQHTPDFIKLGCGGKVTFMPQSYSFVPNLLLHGLYNKILGLKEHNPTIQEQFEHFRRLFS
jgi:hypothetical protein